MNQSRPDEIPITRQIFEMMIQKSDYGRLFHISNTVGMRQHALGFIENQIVCMFHENGNLHLGSLLKNNRREIPFQIINKNLISIFQLIGFFDRLPIY